MTALAIRELAARFCRYGSVGLLGVGVHLGLLSALVDGLHLDYLIATAFAVEGAIVHNFLWHERWTWSDRGLGEKARLLRFAAFHSTTGLVSIGGNLILMRAFVGSLGLHYLLGSIASILTCGLVNFLVSDRLVFVS